MGNTKEALTCEFSENRRIIARISRTIQDPDTNEWIKAEAGFEKTIMDGADIDKEFDKMWEEVELQIEKVIGGESEDNVEDTSTETSEDDDGFAASEDDEKEPAIEENPAEEEVELTPNLINEMTKPELVELCQGIDVLKEINTDKLKIVSLRALIIDTLFTEDDDGTDASEDNASENGATGEWEDDSWES